MVTLSPTPPQPTVAIDGRRETFTVGRVFCVGRNYAAHVKEMNSVNEAIFFMKPASCVEPPGNIPYPPDTTRFDHEIELVIALGQGGRPKTDAQARALIYGYAVGIDLTRRDAQFKLKDEGSPWEACKAFDHSAPIAPIRTADAVGHPREGRIWIEVAGQMKQDADIAEMTLSPEELLIQLARQWALRPGDIVFTGTPAGVGPIAKGQTVRGGIDGLGEIQITVI
jgi:fumarylpyruvate hydrolase